MLSKSENNIICLLFLASIMVFINMGGVSCSLPIGFYALWRFRTFPKPSLYSQHLIWLTLLYIIGIISSVFSPVSFGFRSLYFLFQFIYWLLLTRLIGSLYPVLDKRRLSRTIALGCVILGACNLGIGAGTQNSVAFILVIFGPLGLYGLPNIKLQILYGLGIWGIMFFNESRSGLAILSAELLFISSLYVSRKRIKQLVIAMVVLLGTFTASPGLRAIVGNAIEPYNPEMALLLIAPERVQAYDKSWIQRQVQVQKGLQIFTDHPIIGVGPNNFTPMDVNINYGAISDKVDTNVLNAVSKTADNRSTHNTYVTLLSEFGILGTLCWLFFILPFFIAFYKRLATLQDFEFMIFVTAAGLSVYFYTIAALYGTAAWLFYGLIYGSFVYSKRILQ